MGATESRPQFQKFSLKDHQDYAYIHRIIDGDTVELSIRFPLNKFGTKTKKSGWYSCSARLHGIDVAEKNTPQGILGSQLATQWLLNKKLWCRCFTFDKYGRLLVELSDSPKSKTYNQRFLEYRDSNFGKIAVTYNGKGSKFTA